VWPRGHYSPPLERSGANKRIFNTKKRKETQWADTKDLTVLIQTVAPPAADATVVTASATKAAEERAEEKVVSNSSRKMERKPIVLSKNDVALIQIFHKSDDLLDISIGALDGFMERESVEDAAKQFISQLKGTWTPRFLRALKKEIEIILE